MKANSDMTQRRQQTLHNSNEHSCVTSPSDVDKARGATDVR